MNSNSGTGRLRHERYVGGEYAKELSAMREVLDTAEIVGWPRRDAELADLERLVAKYPDETQQLLARGNNT